MPAFRDSSSKRKGNTAVQKVSIHWRKGLVVRLWAGAISDQKSFDSGFVAWADFPAIRRKYPHPSGTSEHRKDDRGQAMSARVFRIAHPRELPTKARRIHFMPKKDSNAKGSASERGNVSAEPRLHQRAGEIQKYGTVSHMLPLDLEEPVRLEMTEQLNLMLADTMTLRDLYKKSHWQVAGPTFYQLHLLFDKHFGEQVELVDSIAERIQLLGGVSIAMAPDVAETTRIERPPKGREEVPVQISRLLDAHQIIIGHCRELAERADKLGDDGTNDLVVSDVLRSNELQVWFLSQHLVEEPLVKAEEPRLRSAS
jgi:starvation-inducible DNA-binding protein